MSETTKEQSMKLHNCDISAKYKEHKFLLMQCDFMGAFAYWVTAQSPYPTPDITKPLNAFHKYIETIVKEGTVLTVDQAKIWGIINEEVFESIPEIEKLNHAKIEQKGFIASSSRYHKTKPDYDYIDLGALARNIGYMIMREQITQPLD